MRSSLFNFAVFSAVFLSNFCQAAPTGRISDSFTNSFQQIEERVPYSPKTKLFIAKTDVSDVSSKAATETDDDSEISVFEIRDTSGTTDEIKRILLPKGLLDRTAAEDYSDSSSKATGGNEQVQGRLGECGIDKVGRNYCRTSDGWYEYRCETGEMMYFRQMPYADEEVCSDGSIA